MYTTDKDLQHDILVYEFETYIAPWCDVNHLHLGAALRLTKTSNPRWYKVLTELRKNEKGNEYLKHYFRTHYFKKKKSTD